METIFSEILDKHYNQTIINITEQQGGWSALAFRVVTTSGSYFLKAYEKHKASTEKWTAMIDTYMPIVLWLNNNTNLHGKISCPILTNDGQYQCEDNHYIFLLFPYIEGYTLCDKPMSFEQKKEMAEIISELHRYGGEIPVATNHIKEDFTLPFCDELRELVASNLQPRNYEARNILKKYETILINNIKKIYMLAEKLSKESLRHVLCHTDVHGWNLIQASRLILIDWEGLKLAPPEADLFAFIGDCFWHNCSKEFLEIYKKVHPEFKINPDMLTFYQIRRRLEDICAFAQGLSCDDINDEERSLSLYHLSRECSLLS